MCHFNTIRGSEFWFLWIFALFEGWNGPNEENSDFNMIKPADFALLESQKLISRKIWVIEKSWNFHTVKLHYITALLQEKLFWWLKKKLVSVTM